MSNIPVLVHEELAYSPMGDCVGQWHLFDDTSGLEKYLRDAALALVLDDLLETNLVEDATEPPSWSEVVQAALSGGKQLDQDMVALAKQIAEDDISIDERWHLLSEALAQNSNYSFTRYDGFTALKPYLDEMDIEISQAQLRKANHDRSVAEDILVELDGI